MSGNHEVWSRLYDEVKEALEVRGVIVLENQKIEISKEGTHIDLIGLADLAVKQSTWIKTRGLLEELINESKNFKIVLSHRPELIVVTLSNESL